LGCSRRITTALNPAARAASADQIRPLLSVALMPSMPMKRQVLDGGVGERLHMA
jgi:hypothetical protein